MICFSISFCGKLRKNGDVIREEKVEKTKLPKEVNVELFIAK